MIGKSTTIDPPHYEGTRIQYYTSGLKQRISTYKKGTNVDDAFEFYPNGKLCLVVKYPGSTSVEDESEDNYTITANYDSTGVAWVNAGNGTYNFYDEHFKKVIETGAVKDGKREGECTGVSNDGKEKFSEKYENGVLISGSMTDDSGHTTTYSKARFIKPQYKGGLAAFYKYLGA